MAATGVYITQANIENKFTAKLVVDVFDDVVDGASDDDSLQETIDDAENLIEEYVKKTYGAEGLVRLRAEGFDASRSIKRRCLAAVRIYMAERHPDFIRIDIEKAWMLFYEDLNRLRLREVEIAETDGAIEGEGAVNEGGVVRSGDPDDTATVAKFALDGTGLF